MRSLLIIVVAAVVLFPLTATAIEGPVWGIWPGPDTVDVTGEIWVPAGSTLVIDSSVAVVFQGHYKFRVDSSATLVAIGSPTDSILFTAADTSTGWHGIRFYWASDSCQLSYCRIEYGRATGSGPNDPVGGGVFCDHSSPVISHNTVRNNSADWDCGGILCCFSSPTIANNVMTGNSSNANGGAIYCHYSSPTISGSTVSGNSAAVTGGGIYCHDGSSPTIQNSVLWDNAPNEIHVVSGANLSVTYSDIQGGWEGEGNIDTVPLFRNREEGDFHLMADYCGDTLNSPCIDAGHPDSADVILDCLHGLGTRKADMGAYGGGAIGVPLTLTVIPGDTTVAHSDTICYHMICENHTPDYLSLWFKVDVRLPNGQPYGPIFGPARFGMFGNGISEGDMCHFVPPQAPVGDYWLFAEAYNLELSARDSMAFTVTGDAELAGLEPTSGDWQTVVARLGDKDFIGKGVVDLPPAEFALNSNYPNPFNARTVIRYQLPATSDVKLEIYNLLGERVATLVDETQQAGYRSIFWDASEVSSGLYFYKLTAGEFTETRRMMLVR